MKRRKKTTLTPGQLALFDEEPGSQKIGEAEISPVEALKSFALTLIPPEGIEAPQTPQNGLKTEIPQGDELNRLWKENPEALKRFNQMAKKNPAVLSLVRRLALVPLCILLLFSCGRSHPQNNFCKEENFHKETAAGKKMPLSIEDAVFFLVLAEVWHDPIKTAYTGWGHRYDYDSVRVSTPFEADSLAASDLRALCARFRDFQGDSLLLALLAYNVGVKAIKTSSLMDSLTFDAYTSFCYIKGERSERQFHRRRAEWMLFKTDRN